MGLSSNIYGGHIFWDAEVWMMPALIVQHPDYAKSIIDYRFKTAGAGQEERQSAWVRGSRIPLGKRGHRGGDGPGGVRAGAAYHGGCRLGGLAVLSVDGRQGVSAKEGWPVLSSDGGVLGFAGHAKARTASIIS